jgi:general secretion pathway protein C
MSFHHNRLMKIANANTGSNTWTLRLFTLLVWAGVGLCAAYWALKFSTTKPVEAAVAAATPVVVVDTKAIAKLLGATDSGASQATNTSSKTKLSLFGLATSPSGQGIALIATEDKPAKPYYVGSKVTDDLVLKSISKTDAVLAASVTAPDGQKLELPVRKPGTIIVSTTAAPPQPQIPAATAPSVIPIVPNLANSVGALNPAIADAMRPISRFAPRTPGASNTQAPANAAVGAVNPAAAATAVSSTSDSVIR